MRFPTSFACLLPLILLASPARAGEAHDPVAAEALFSAGRELRNNGDYAGACVKFAESQRLDPAPGTLINLADCNEHIGHLGTAWQAWHEAIDSLSATDDRLPDVKKRLAALDPRVPRVTIHVSGGPASGLPAGTTLRRDDVVLGVASLDVRLPLDPGTHVIELTAPGRKTQRYSFAVSEGDIKQVDVALGPVEAAPVEPPKTPRNDDAPSPGATQRTMGLVVGGAGIVALAFGAASGIVAIRKKHVVDEGCPENACSKDGYDAARSGKTWATVSTFTVIGGFAAVGAGAVLLLSAPKSAASSGASGSSISISMTPSSLGLALRGRF